mgnify:CR=1 FL=1
MQLFNGTTPIAVIGGIAFVYFFTKMIDRLDLDKNSEWVEMTKRE